jgi:hypothetical protein
MDAKPRIKCSARIRNPLALSSLAPNCPSMFARSLTNNASRASPSNTRLAHRSIGVTHTVRDARACARTSHRLLRVALAVRHALDQTPARFIARLENGYTPRALRIVYSSGFPL